MIASLLLSGALLPSAPLPAARLSGALQLGPQARAPAFDACADGEQAIAAALERARAENRRVLVVWGANWCGWCRSLHALFENDRAVRQEILYEYEVVPIDVGRFDKHLDLMLRYGLDPRQTGIPFLTFLESDGRVLANQATTSLELHEPGRKAHEPARVFELLVQHRPLYPDARDLLDPALALAGVQDRRVFLHFGAPWCAWCHRFETWLASPDVRAILEKDLVLRKIDIDRTVDGDELLHRLAGAPKVEIPWYAVLDAAGNAIATSAGPDGAPGGAIGGATIGNPRTPEQIERFGEMLTRACKKLGAEDVETLKRSLTAASEREAAEKAKAASDANVGGG